MACSIDNMLSTGLGGSSMLKNLDESRDRRCSSHDKDLNSGHDGTVQRAQLTEKSLRNYSRIARESLMVTCHVVFWCSGMASSDKLLCDGTSSANSEREIHVSGE